MNDKSPVVNFITPAFFDMNGNNMFFGGAERYLIELIRLIRRMGYETNVYQCANSRWVRYYHDIRITGVEAQNTDQLNHYFHTGFHQGFLTIYFAFFLASPYFHQPSIGVSHGIYWDEEIFQHFPHSQKALRQILSAISHLSTLVSVDTNTINWLRTVHLELATRSVYIPNFVDQKQFHPEYKKDDVGGTRLVILYPRRLNQVRGFWLTHRLVPEILEKYDNVDFHFVGRADTREEQAVRRLVERFPERVKWYFLPPNRMHEAYQRADIVLIPTTQSEGTSLSCLEAMASGRAVIATNVGGLPNLVLPDYNGLLIEPDVESLRNALVRLVESPELRSQFARRGIEVAKVFDIEIWRSRWQKVLQKYLPAQASVVEDPVTVVFYPRQDMPWNASADYYLRNLAEQLAECGLDVYWVQSTKEAGGNERLHLLTMNDDLYLSRPWVFFDGGSNPYFLGKHEEPIIICDVSGGFSETLAGNYRNHIDLFISNQENSSANVQDVKYVPDAVSLIKLIQERNG